jgi:manganese transport protein
MRKMEMFIISMIAIIGGCFVVEMAFAKPDVGAIATGFIPSLPSEAALYIAIGIIGATVMPHNLYLHSALVQTRKVKRDDESIRKAIKYNFWDSAIALNLYFTKGAKQMWPNLKMRTNCWPQCWDLNGHQDCLQ